MRFGPLTGVLGFAAGIIGESNRKRRDREYYERAMERMGKPTSTMPKATHPEPHRDPKTGKIVIENSQLYNADVKQFGAVKAQQWVKEGKYNLSPEELRKEEDRIKAEMDYLFSLL